MTDKIKVVMGWDIGYYDSMACVGIIGNCYVSPLYLHRSRDLEVVKSVVAKTENGVIRIGEDAVNQQEFVTDFIQSPRYWDKKSSYDVTYRQHMSDFIKGLSETILQNSSNRGTLKDVITQNDRGEMCWKKDEVLLVVSCPNSEEWKGEKIREQYEEFVSETTGILNVKAIDEPIATLFSLAGRDEKIDPEAGSLVLDLGSFEMKATYVLPTRETINIIYKPGTRQIENAMLDYILKSAEGRRALELAAKIHNKTRVFAIPNGYPFFQLRMDKEDYYDRSLAVKREPKPGNIGFSIIDEDGDKIYEYESPDEETVVCVRYWVTDEMMQYAVDGYKFSAVKNGEVVGYDTWRQNFRQFLIDVELTIARENLPLRLVVITGDSVLPFITEEVNDIFPKQNVIPIEPECTAEGLVIMGLYSRNQGRDWLGHLCHLYERGWGIER